MTKKETNRNCRTENTTTYIVKKLTWMQFFSILRWQSLKEKRNSVGLKKYIWRNNGQNFPNLGKSKKPKIQESVSLNRTTPKKYITEHIIIKHQTFKDKQKSKNQLERNNASPIRGTIWTTVGFSSETKAVRRKLHMFQLLKDQLDQNSIPSKNALQE